MSARHPAINRYITQLLPYRGGEQRGLAEHLGVSEAAVSRWISFESSPRAALWPGIADYFDIDVAEIEAMASGRQVPDGPAPGVDELRVELLNLRSRIDRMERLWDLEHPDDQRVGHAIDVEWPVKPDVEDHALAAASGDNASEVKPGPRVERPSPRIEPDDGA